jgi:hypothetical protein
MSMSNSCSASSFFEASVPFLQLLEALGLRGAHPAVAIFPTMEARLDYPELPGDPRHGGAGGELALRLLSELAHYLLWRVSLVPNFESPPCSVHPGFLDSLSLCVSFRYGVWMTPIGAEDGFVDSAV